MNMKKRMVAFLTVLTISIMCAVSSFAAEIVPFGAICGHCGIGSMNQTSTDYTAWHTAGTTPCTHGNPWAIDEIIERTVTVTWTCSHCGYSQSAQSTETDIRCHG